MLEFDWDEENIKHIAEHNVTPEEAEQVLENPTLDMGFQNWHDEERFVEAGATSTGRVLEVVTTWRGIKTRVITAYDADPNVVKEYYRTR